MCHVGNGRLAVGLGQDDVGEDVTIIAEQSLIGAQQEMSHSVLVDAVDIVGVQSALIIYILLDDAKVVAIVYIDTVAGGDPDKSVGILVHLRHEIARELVVRIE